MFNLFKKKVDENLEDDNKETLHDVSYFDDFFWELEVAMLESNIANEVIDEIKEKIKLSISKDKISKKELKKIIYDVLYDVLCDILDFEDNNLIEKIKEHKQNQKDPFVIVFIGINGSGKTTTIAKIAKLLNENDISCVISASDTFRAAAIHQIEEHSVNLGIKLIKHDYGSDPAAVSFDAINYAKSKHIDCVLVDTAGRTQNNENLMNELKKITRVSNPNLKVLVIDSLTGNDATEQVKLFNQIIGIDGVILTKFDADEKGGTFISVAQASKKPIYFIGIGQEYSDLEQFDKEDVLDMIFSNIENK